LKKRHRWENIKKDLKEIRLEGVDWINLPHSKDWSLVFMDVVMNFAEM
jgi:hypothetical protein